MSKRTANRVLLIGWDAADWQVIQPLMDQGLMPTLKRLVEGGASGNLATIQPVLSPMLWNSIATGKRADKHGICGFLEPKPDRSGVRPVSSTSRKCKAVWNILTQAGLRSNVVSWFASHPAEPINGSVVTDRFVSAVAEGPDDASLGDGTFHPKELEGEFRPLIVTPSDIEVDALLPFIPRAAEIDQSHDDRLAKLANLIARASTVHAATCRLVEQPDWDFTAVYYAALDEFGHHFMPYHPPRLSGVSERDAGIYGEVMNGCYRFHDMMLEALLAYAGEDTTVILVSDHGFKNDEKRPGTDATEQPVDWHREFGIVCASGPGIQVGTQLYGATLLDVTPTVLSLFGLPVGQDMDGRPWLEVFSSNSNVSSIASWEEVRSDAGMHPDDLQEDPAEAAEAMRHLIELGYVEAPGEDVEELLSKLDADRTANLAMALSSSKRAHQAVALWEKLVGDHPEEEGYLIQLAACCLGLGRIDQSEDALNRIKGPLGNSPFVRLLHASVSVQRGDKSEALERVRAELERGIEDPYLLNRAGSLLMKLESWDEADRVFSQSLELLPDNAVALHGLAELALEKCEYERAVVFALKAVGLIHFYPPAHFVLGESLFHSGREEEAIAAFETCLSMGQQPERSHSRLAALYRLRDPEKASEHRQFALID